MRTEEVFDFLNKTKASFGDAADRVLEYTAFENFYDRKYVFLRLRSGRGAKPGPRGRSE